MREHEDNPSANALPPGISPDALVNGIAESGFPLQGKVAHALAAEFTVVEEWGFIDDQSGEHRALDIFASRDLPGAEKEIAPSIDVLIECKRSRNPYVFFQTAGIRHIPEFPCVSGLRSSNINVSERGRGRSTTRPVSSVLCLDALPFVTDGPFICGAYSQAVPKGKDNIELSGTDPFNRVMLPLVKAVRHAQSMLTIGTTQQLIFPTLIIAVCVLEAPMLLVEEPTAAADPVLIPWVRVARREATRDKDGRLRNRFFAVDFVHAAFLTRFVTERLLPFAEEFARRTVLLADGLRHGVSVPSLDSWAFSEVHSRNPGR